MVRQMVRHNGLTVSEHVLPNTEGSLRNVHRGAKSSNSDV